MLSVILMPFFIWQFMRTMLCRPISSSSSKVKILLCVAYFMMKLMIKGAFDCITAITTCEWSGKRSEEGRKRVRYPEESDGRESEKNERSKEQSRRRYGSGNGEMRGDTEICLYGKTGRSAYMFWLQCTIVDFFFFLSRGSRTVGASYEIPPRRAILCMVWRLL